MPQARVIKADGSEVFLDADIETIELTAEGGAYELTSFPLGIERAAALRAPGWEFVPRLGESLARTKAEKTEAMELALAEQEKRFAMNRAFEIPRARAEKNDAKDH